MPTDYLFVEWEGHGDCKEHSVIPGKVAELVGVAGDQGYVQGAKLRCKLKEGIFFAILLATGLCLCACISIYIANIGNRSECVAAQNRLEKETGKLHIWVKHDTPYPLSHCRVLR